MVSVESNKENDDGMKKLTPEQFGILEHKIQDCIWEKKFNDFFDPRSNTTLCPYKKDYCPYQGIKQGYRLPCMADEPKTQTFK